jgi:hypothetical protein
MTEFESIFELTDQTPIISIFYYIRQTDNIIYHINHRYYKSVNSQPYTLSLNKNPSTFVHVLDMWTISSNTWQPVFVKLTNGWTIIHINNEGQITLTNTKFHNVYNASFSNVENVRLVSVSLININQPFTGPEFKFISITSSFS